jgi:hypothetical protein
MGAATSVLGLGAAVSPVARIASAINIAWSTVLTTNPPVRRCRLAFDSGSRENTVSSAEESVEPMPLVTLGRMQRLDEPAVTTALGQNESIVKIRRSADYESMNAHRVSLALSAR